MEEAKDYKKYLKALKEATKKSGKRKKNNKRPEIGIQGMLVARPFLKKLGGSMSKTDKKKFNPRTGEETNKPRGKDPRTIYKPENMKPKPITKKMGGLTGGQKKLDKNKNNRIDAQDFKILKAEKAKGRGMGLQDEKVKPGKVMKAALGAVALGLGAKKLKEKGKLMPLGLGAAMMKKEKMKKILGRSKGGGADTGTRGEIRSKLSVAADKFKRRMSQMPGKISDEERKKIKELLKDVKPARPARPMPNIKSDGPKRPMPSRPKPSLGPMARRMGGGMMNKPMGYKKGASIMARGCKLGRKKATKLY